MTVKKAKAYVETLELLDNPLKPGEEVRVTARFLVTTIMSTKDAEELTDAFKASRPCAFTVQFNDGKKRAPIQAESRSSKNADKGQGTISWEEHEACWAKYAVKYGTQQSAERLAERGGFGYNEFIILMGREPETFEKNESLSPFR